MQICGGDQRIFLILFAQSGLTIGTEGFQSEIHNNITIIQRTKPNGQSLSYKVYICNHRDQKWCAGTRTGVAGNGCSIKCVYCFRHRCNFIVRSFSLEEYAFLCLQQKCVLALLLVSVVHVFLPLASTSAVPVCIVCC